MSLKIVVGCDDSELGSSTLEYATKLAKTQGATLVVAHVLEWSPYSFLTPSELEERHVRRKEELARAEEAIMKPIVEAVRAQGIEVVSELRYGNIAETLIDIAKDQSADMIIIGRTGNSGFSSRVFGSVAGTLSQASTVPVTIVP